MAAFISYSKVYHYGHALIIASSLSFARSWSAVLPLFISPKCMCLSRLLRDARPEPCEYIPCDDPVSCVELAPLKHGKRNMKGRRSMGKHAQMMPTLASISVQIERGMKVPG